MDIVVILALIGLVVYTEISKDKQIRKLQDRLMAKDLAEYKAFEEPVVRRKEDPKPQTDDIVEL